MAVSLMRTLQMLETSGNGPTAKWEVPLNDGNHIVEFIHGTATGQRIVKIDGNVLLHKDWMFRLVGDEIFTFADNKFVIRVDPIPGMQYSYTLWVNGKSYENFVQAQSKVLETWQTDIDGSTYRITLDKTTLVIWLNGEQVEAENDFIDGGAEMRFEICDKPVVIRSYSCGQKNTEIQYSLFLNDEEISKQSLVSDIFENDKSKVNKS